MIMSAMLDISFEIKGEEVKPDSFKDVLDIIFLRHIREKIEMSIGSMCCQEHGKQPTIKVKGQNLDNLTYEVSGCCDKLIASVHRKIK